MTFRSALAAVEADRGPACRVPSPKRWTLPAGVDDLERSLADRPLRGSREETCSLRAAAHAVNASGSRLAPARRTRMLATRLRRRLNRCRAGASTGFRRPARPRPRLRPEPRPARRPRSRSRFLGRCRQVLARGLARGLVLAARDVDGDLRLDLRVEGDGDGVEADRLDRLVEGDLAARDREAAGVDRLGEVAGRDRAVELPGLAGLADDDEGLAVELGGDRLGLAACARGCAPRAGRARASKRLRLASVARSALPCGSRKLRA